MTSQYPRPFAARIQKVFWQRRAASIRRSGSPAEHAQNSFWDAMVKRVREGTSAAQEQQTQAEHPPKRSASKSARAKRAAAREASAGARPSRRGQRRRTEAELLEDRLTPHFALQEAEHGTEHDEHETEEFEFEKTVVSSTVRRTFAYSPDMPSHEERTNYVIARESPDDLPARSRYSARGRHRGSLARRESIQPLARPNFRSATEEAQPVYRSRRSSLTREQRMQQDWSREAFAEQGPVSLDAALPTPREQVSQTLTAGPPQRSWGLFFAHLFNVIFYPVIVLSRWLYHAAAWPLARAAKIGSALRWSALRDSLMSMSSSLVQIVQAAGGYLLWLPRQLRRRAGDAEAGEAPSVWRSTLKQWAEMVLSFPFALLRLGMYCIGYAFGFFTTLPQWAYLKASSILPSTLRLVKKYKTPLLVAGVAILAAWLLGMSLPWWTKPTRIVHAYNEGKSLLEWLAPDLTKRLWSGVTWLNPFGVISKWLPSFSLPTLGSLFAGKQPWAPFARPGVPTLPKYMGSWTSERSYSNQKQYLDELVRDIEHAQRFISSSKRDIDGELAIAVEKLNKLLQYQEILTTQLDGLESQTDDASLLQFRAMVDEVKAMHDEAQSAHRLLLASTQELEARFHHIWKGGAEDKVKNPDKFFGGASHLIHRLEVESASLVNQLALTTSRMEIGLTKAEASQVVDTLYSHARQQLQGRLEGSAAEYMISKLVSEVATELKSSGGVVTIDRIRSRIDSILQEKIADISLIDFAAAAMGASIVKGEPYTSSPFVSFMDMRTRLRYWFGLERAGALPEVAISHGKHTWRNCYAFKGQHGAITIKLVKPIFPTQLGVYHILEQVAVTPESAPSKFRVWGWYRSPDPARTVSELPWPLSKVAHPPNERPTTFDSTFYDGWNKHGPITSDDLAYLGEYEYDIKKREALQIALLDKSRLDHLFQPIEAITVEVMANSGHSEYTCVYGLRVYGGDPEGHRIIH